jgi:V8-like Glu-specific endopeptidase
MDHPAYDASILTELRKLLAALYPSDSDQRRLASEAKLTVGAIPFGSSAYNNWHQILSHAKNNRGVLPLLALALEEFPDNDQLARLAEGQPSRFVDGGPFAWQGPANGRALLEQVVSGKSSLVHVSHLAVGLQRAQAVAKIVRADGGSGTAFLIDGDRLVTNHHVLPGADSASDGTAIFNFQKAAAGYDEAAEALKLEPERCFQTSRDDDFTVVGVSGAPVSRWGRIELKPHPVARGDRVNIIQHPGGGPKQLGLSFDVVAFVGAGRLQYLTDTLPGSSGAPVFDSQWNLVALHHSGGWLVEPGSLEKRVYYRNEGILVERLIGQLGA